MSLPKRTLILAGALCAIGVLLRAFGVSWGLDVLVVSVLVAVVSVSFTQRTVQNELATMRKNVTQRLQALSARQETLEQTLKEHGRLQRTTLYYAKNGSSGNGKHTEVVPVAAVAMDPHRSGIAGRSSTPEVSNINAHHTFAGLLDPTAEKVVGGVMTPEAIEALPEGTTYQPLLPFRATELLTVEPVIGLIVVDEASFESAPWDRAVGPVGIGMMKDLDRALRLALEKGAQVVVLRHEGTSDIHSTALNSVRALRLPLSEADLASTAGAPSSPVLSALAAFVDQRRSM
ncbi:hypothetical protein [Brachybacterium sp. UNK5269]|uniref:hypothetical protein n=1 Tax=Brachybacterium sp. UNK5269 TaxID=3408576 RepID=UPI003BB04561